MRIWLAAGAGSAFLAVALGAFAAHGLAGRLAPEALGWIETGARYGLAHGVALIALAPLGRKISQRMITFTGICFVAGSVAFCVTLYVMALTGWRGLAVVVPFGGAAFLLGWAALLVAALRR